MVEALRVEGGAQVTMLRRGLAVEAGPDGRDPLIGAETV
jgi:hypothetical protein